MIVKKNKIPLRYFFALVALALFSTVSNGQEKPKLNQCSGSDFKVNVEVVQPLGGSQVEFFLLEYTYEFKKRNTVFIKTIGEISATGKMKLLYQGSKLEFLSALNGELLCTIELKPNKRSPEGGAGDVPEPSVFSSYRNEATSVQNKWEFLGRVTAVLNNNGFTYRIDDQNGVTTVTSNYSNLSGLPSNLRGEIAVQISFPRQQDGERFSFYISYHARQKPRKSEEWQDLTAENQGAVNSVIKAVANDLR